MLDPNKLHDAVTVLSGAEILPFLRQYVEDMKDSVGEGAIPETPDYTRENIIAAFQHIEFNRIFNRDSRNRRLREEFCIWMDNLKMVCEEKGFALPFELT